MEPYLGQIMQVGFSFAPRYWTTCQGQTIAISQNSALFSLLGTSFGGDGMSTFMLPNAGGRAFVGTGRSPGTSTYAMGEVTGTESVTMTSLQMPMHTHTAVFTPSGGAPSLQALSNITGTHEVQPTDGAHLTSGYDANNLADISIYCPTTATGTAVNLGGLSVPTGGSVAVAPAGGSQPIPILQPILAVTTVIALQGVFPSRN